MKNIAKGTTILIPTWNNLPYLRKCVENLRKYSAFDHEIVLHINDGSDGTLEYAEADPDIRFTHTEENVGIAKAINQCAKLATKDYVWYFNDDMFALPGWDTEVANFAEQHNIDDNSWLSSTLIEPKGHNPCFVANGDEFNYGTELGAFDEARLIQDLPRLREYKKNMNGTTWVPNVMHVNVWEKVGGLSEEYAATNDYGTDPDIAKKMYDLGCRTFVGVGRSLVYHFISVVNRRRRAISGRPVFQQKHGMSIDDFVTNVLKRGTEWKGPLQ